MPDAEYSLETELHIASAVVLDIMDLSGYALLLAEYHQNSEIWKPVESVWRSYLDNSPERLKLLAGVVTLEHIRFQIPHRGLLRTNWSTQVHEMLRQLPQGLPMGMYSSSHRVQHPSPLVRYVARDEWTDGLDVFIGEFLLKLPGAQQLSWGRHSVESFAEGVKWEEEHSETDLDEDA